MTAAPWWLQALGSLASLFVVFSVGVWWGHYVRDRRAAWEHAVDLEHIADLAGQLVEAEQAIASCREELPTRLQRAYDAGQGAMLEQLTGLCAAEPWVPVSLDKWVALMEARGNLEAN